jgi:hypothetical protein
MLGGSADDSLLFDAILEEDECWDAHDVMGSGGLRVVVDVEFADVEAIMLLGDLLEDRRNYPAWATPFGPEVNKDRRLGADLIIESPVVEGANFSHFGFLLFDLPQ